MKTLIITLILILAAGNIFSDDTTGKDTMNAEENNSMMMSDTMMSDPGSFTTGGKIYFTSLEDAMETAATNPAVLFFYADWCPTCRTALHDIDGNGEKLGNITVIIVNYDKEKDLIKKYGIVYQHTFVQINRVGEKIAVWNGGGIDTILKRIVTIEEK